MILRLSALLFLAAAAASPLRAQVVGQVLEEGSRAPIENAEVLIPGTASRRVTDSEGYFRFPRLQPGNHRLVVQHLAYEPRQVQVTVVTGRFVQVPVQTRLLRPPPFPAGTGLRLLSAALGPEPVEGEVARVRGDTLFLRIGDLDPPRGVRLSSLERLEIRHLENRSSDGAVGGAILGSLAGLVAGPLLDVCFAGRSCEAGAQVMVGGLFGGVAGGVVGGVLGATILESARWILLPFSPSD